MKDKIRERVIRMSNAALLCALSTTACFTGCSNSDVEKTEDSVVINDKEYKEVNEGNLHSFDSIQLGDTTSGDGETGDGEAVQISKSQFNPLDLFKPYIDQTAFDETRDELSAQAVGTFGTGNNIYMDKDGELTLIDNGLALKFVEVANSRYKLEKDDSLGVGSYVLINDKGGRTLVFESTQSLCDFAAELQAKYDALAENQVGAMVNGVTFSAIDKPIEVELFNGSQEFYNLEQVLDACKSHIEQLNNLDSAIKYEIKDDYVTVIRTRYIRNVESGEIETVDVEFTLPLGDKGGTYYEPDYELILPMSFKEDGSIYVSIQTLTDLIGIDISNGYYSIPTTDVTLTDIININTYEYSNYDIMVDKEVEIVPEDEIEVRVSKIYEESSYEFVVDYSDLIYDDSTPIIVDGGFANEVEEVMNPSADAIDPVVSAAVGFDVPVLTGTPEEKAARLAEIMTEHYSYMGLTFSSGGSTGMAVDNWPEIDWSLTQEEAAAKCREVLGADHPLTGLTVEEAYSVGSWLAVANWDEYYRIKDMLCYSFYNSESSGGIHICW